MLKRVAIFHHPQSEGAAVFAGQLARELDRTGVESFVNDAWQETDERLDNCQLMVCIGGDGTVLRAARISV
ncbi:MAG TPA: hypothetical protein VFY90_12940, partial [Tepidiformaceae bacterium]|nr:hypothetical protein [Tepidiformaceae bacterium]